MNNKYSITLVIIIILITGNCFILLKTIFRNDYSKEKSDQNFYYERKKISEIEHMIEFQKLDTPLYTSDKMRPTDVFKSNINSILIFQFSMYTCQPCLETIIDSIKKIFPDYEKRADIIFISNDLEDRLKRKYFEKKIASIPENKYNMLINKNTIPALFIIDSSFRIHNFFLIDKKTPDFTGQYLRIVKTRYFNKHNEDH